MKLYEAQCAKWDRVHFYKAPKNGEEIVFGDKVIYKNGSNLDLLNVIGVREVTESTANNNQEEIRTILRKANDADLEKAEALSEKREADLTFFADAIGGKELPMKVVDICYSLEGGKITFAFTAEGRVDFRELVKELTSHYKKAVRLQQLGIRDAARVLGDIGACGLVQCCKTHLKGLANIPMEMAEVQQVAHRGSDRLSGACGRLKCCLAYELSNYEENFGKMPAVGSRVMTKDGKKGVIKGWHTLDYSVDIWLEESSQYARVPVPELKILK